MLRIEACGEKSQGLWNLASKPLILWRGKEEGLFFLKKKKKIHIKIDPFAKQFLNQEAPPPLSLETEGKVWGWSQDSPHFQMRPKLWGGREEEGLWLSRGLVLEEGRERPGQALSHPACPPPGPGLGHSRTGQRGLGPPCLGRSLSNGGVGGGSARHFLGSTSQCLPTSNRQQEPGQAEQRWEMEPRGS